MNGFETLIALVSGAVILAYGLAGVFFVRFWRKTRDPLFLSFAFAFWLFAINHAIGSLIGDADERTGQVYLLRVLGFGLMLLAIIRKNLAARGEH